MNMFHLDQPDLARSKAKEKWKEEVKLSVKITLVIH